MNWTMEEELLSGSFTRSMVLACLILVYHASVLIFLDITYPSKLASILARTKDVIHATTVYTIIISCFNIQYRHIIQNNTFTNFTSKK